MKVGMNPRQTGRDTPDGHTMPSTRRFSVRSVV